MPTPIDRYISQVRINHPERVNENIYELLVGESFRAFVNHFGINTKLKVLYTPSRRAERVRISGQSWLIYDQYLGQTFNILNRIFFNAEGEKEAIVYFHKYAAERTVEYGCAELGIELANFYQDQRECLRKTAHREQDRGIFTAVAEQFAVYHELSHEIIELEHDFVDALSEIVSESISERKRLNLSQTCESIIDALKSADPAAYHGASLKEAIAETQADFESEEGVRGRRAYLQALDDTETAEELFCDFLACEFVLSTYEVHGADIRTALRALYIASYHLKTMDLVDRALGAFLLRGGVASNEPWQRIEGIQATQVRNHCLRDHVLFLYATRIQGRKANERKELIESLSIQLMKDQGRYYERILDPASKVISFLTEPGELQKMASRQESSLASFAKDAPEGDVAEVRNALASIVVFKQTDWPISSISKFARALGN